VKVRKALREPLRASNWGVDAIPEHFLAEKHIFSCLVCKLPVYFVTLNHFEELVVQCSSCGEHHTVKRYTERVELHPPIRIDISNMGITMKSTRTGP